MMATLLKKILLIEDSQTDSFLIQRAMREYPALSSHTLIIHDNMKSAQEYLDANRGSISLILLDLGLPDTTDGQDTYEQLCHNNITDIPVIALTSVNNRNIAIALAEQGLEDFLCKTDVMYAPLLLAQSINFVLSRNINKVRSVRDMMGDIDSYAGIISFPNA
jgi:DNA-binding response OmpR family regulator